MFFSNGRKEGEQLAGAVRNALTTVFIGSKYQSQEDYSVSFPTDFFDDDYIQGYTVMCALFLIKFALGGDNWKTNKRTNCVITICNIIDPIGDLQYGAKSKVWPNEENYPEFGRGMNDAGLVVGATYNALRPDLDSPILKEAHELAKKITNQGLDPDGADNSLATALQLVTIGRYATEKWISEEELRWSISLAGFDGSNGS